MSLLSVILVLVLIGLLLYAINRWIPMQATVKLILNIIVIIILVFWLLRITGLLNAIDSVKV